MRILITGGSGFIGSWVVPLLLRRGTRVAVITRYPEDSPFRNATDVSHIQGDISSAETVSNAVRAFRPEALVHLAWKGLPDYSPPLCLHNLELGLRVYQEALTAGIRTIITAGSCWEYNSRQGKVNEEDATGSASPFASVKTALRIIGQTLAAQQNSSFYWLRFFYLYGPGQRAEALLPSILRAARQGNAPHINTPENRHDFIHVADAALALARVLETRPKESVYNVGSGVATSVAEVVALAYRAMNLEPPLFKPTDTSERYREDYWADTDRIHQKVGWQSQVDLQSGVKSAVEQRILEAA